MSEFLTHSWLMFARHARGLSRHRIWIAMLLVQPLFWIVLYSQLFERVTALGGFGTRSYIDFIMPGIVIMTGFFAGSWAGMGMIEDLDRGFVERMLATPVRRGAIVAGHVTSAALKAAVQAVLLIAVGYVLGARIAGGAIGWAAILAAAILVTASFAGISHGIALLTRKADTMIAIANFIGLPLMFLSAILIARPLMPDWMRFAAQFNPVDWAVVAAREPALPGTDWSSVAVNLGLLAAFSAATIAFATWAFRAYQRTL